MIFIIILPGGSIMDYYNVTVVIPSLNPDEKLMNLINAAAGDARTVPENFVIQINIDLSDYPYEYREFFVTVTLYSL